MSNPVISNQERRARLAHRHHLAPGDGASDITEVAGSLVGIHATEPTTVYLATWARVVDATRGGIEESLYDRRSVVRILGMRRTMFVVPLDLAPLLDVGCARPLAERERRRTEKMLTDAGLVEDAGTWLKHVADKTLAALEQRGEAVATELSEDVPELATRIPVGQGRKWAGEIGLSTRVLFLLATEGRIVRGRPRGSWGSSQYRWTPMDRWVQTADHGLSLARARAELVACYLGQFGPASETDVGWWTGWTKTDVRAAVAAVGAVEVDLEGEPGWILDDDLAPAGETKPWVELLPGLDSTTMGWKERHWYLGDHGTALFDSNGNAGPTVWADGRVVGGWGQTKAGEVVWRLLEDVGAERENAISARAAELTAWLDGSVVAPRFPSPLQRELAAG